MDQIPGIRTSFIIITLQQSLVMQWTFMPLQKSDLHLIKYGFTYVVMNMIFLKYAQMM